MSTFYKSFEVTFLFVGAIGLASFSHAEEYNLSYGARLTEANGAPILGQDGKLDLEVSFYNAGVGGSPIGPSPISFPGTSITEGVFQLSITLDPTEFHQVFQDPSTPVYIEVKDVKSGAVFPRQRFSVIPFALKTPIDNDTIVYNSDGKLTVGSSVGTVKQVTAGSGLTGGAITDSGTITVDTGTTGNKIVQLNDGKLPSVDGSNLSSVNAEKLQTRNISAAVPVSGQVLKWSGSAWVPSSDLVGETGSGEANTASNATSASGVGLFKGKVSADLMFYSLSPGAGVTINLVGDDVVVASTITQYTDAMAKAAAVADSIADSVTTIAPSQNAVFDALATKQASVTTATDLSLNSITTNAVNAITVNPGVSTGEIKLKELSVNGTNYVGLKAPGNITSDLTFTLPGGVGSNGQFLKTDGSGNLSWTDQASAPVTSVNTLTGAVTLTSTNITEGTNLYYSDARAKNAAVGDAITDAITDKAPSQNAVFDALALKSATSHNHTGVYEPAGLSTDVVTTTKILNDSVTSAKIASGVDAAKVGGGAVDNTEFSYLNGVTSAIQTQFDGKASGPASATDNAIARFDGTTGKLVQNSSVVIDDSGNVGVGTTSPTTKFNIVDSTSINGELRVSSSSVASLGGMNIDTWANNLSTTPFQMSRIRTSLPYGGAVGQTTTLEFQTMVGGSLAERMRIDSTGKVGIGTTSPIGKLDVNGSICITGDCLVSWSSASNIGNDSLLYNGDFETGSIVGWSGITSIVSGGYSGNYAAQATGQGSILSDYYIPVDPTRDVFELEGYFKKSVVGSTPGVLYFGYIAYDASKAEITTAPCGAYCYFAAWGYAIPADNSWHKFAATTTGEGSVFPNFPVGTRFVRVLAIVNYWSSADAVTQVDHVTLKRINHGPLFVGNKYSGSDLVDQTQTSQIYTTSANNLIITPPANGNVGIGTASPSATLDVSGAIKVGSLAVSCDGTQEGKQRYNSASHNMEFCNGSAWTSMNGAAGAIPAGTIAFFSLASCPSGWTEKTALRGRYPVGLPSGGTLGLTDGTALSNGEDRPVGQHNHGITDPGHSHQLIGTGSSSGANNGSWQYAGALLFNDRYTLGAVTGITINNAGSVAGTNAPYIQYLACEKQ